MGDLLLLEDLEDVAKTRKLEAGDLEALRATGDWIRTFVAKPHNSLGRPGPVCPFVPVALERHAIRLASERVADRSIPDVVQLIRSYENLLLNAQFPDRSDANYDSIIVVFSDLSSDRAKTLFAGVLQHAGVPSYADSGLVMGGFHEGAEGSAIYNRDFRPFTAPVPFLLLRHAVVSDWKFFLDNEEWLALWAHRYKESATRTLAEELRRLPWRVNRD